MELLIPLSRALKMNIGEVNIRCIIFITMITQNFHSSSCGRLSLLSKLDNRPQKQHPLVLIPGIGGSQVYCLPKQYKAKPFPVWLSLLNMVFPSRINHLAHLKYDPIKQISVDNDNCEIVFPGWGDTKVLENINSDGYSLGNYFHDLVNTLKGDNYFKSNFTIRGAPYDFRRSPIFMTWLKRLIEETYVNGCNRSVVIVAHSLGSLYTKYFLDRQTSRWKEKYIKTFISAAAPFGGSMVALSTILSGTNFDIFIHNPMRNRLLFRTLTSVSFLLPNPQLWPPDLPVIFTPTKNYTLNLYHELFQDINFPIGYQMMISSKHQSDMIKDPQNVPEILCVHSSNLLSVKQLIYKTSGYFVMPFLITHQY
ncbi:unnamed protein product [Heterobilharzia americana]|nr:unnamed protein product [Heterobilharzia americana]